MEWHLCAERVAELWTSTIPALTLMSGDKNSLEHFDMLTNISAKPALNIRFLPLPANFEQIAQWQSPTLQLHWNWWRAKPPPSSSKPQLILSGPFFSQFVSDGRNWILITETGRRSRINQWFLYLTARWMRVIDTSVYAIETRHSNVHPGINYELWNLIHGFDQRFHPFSS